MEEVLHAFGIDWRLLLIQAFNFGLTLFVLWYFLYTPAMRLLDERRERIARGVREAEEAATIRAGAEREKTEVMARTGKEAEALLAAAEKRSGERERALLAEAQEKGRRVLEEAAEKAAEERRRALEEGKEEIARMAVLAAERVLRGEAQK